MAPPLLYLSYPNTAAGKEIAAILRLHTCMRIESNCRVSVFCDFHISEKSAPPIPIRVKNKGERHVDMAKGIISVGIKSFFHGEDCPIY